jgi:polar amino acid transport system permease protein
LIEYLNESLFGPGKRSYLSAIFALGLNSAAYQCETIRGAIAAIPSGQMEAGRSIGLTYMGTMRLIILPQAIRICIPPLGNEMVNLVLNSSLASVIAYTELTRQGKLVVAITFQIFWTWGMVMISYFVVTWTLAILLRRLEEKTRIPGLGISGGN